MAIMFPHTFSQVNRIKFNSMNVQFEQKSKSAKLKSSRSNSCPDLAEVEGSTPMTGSSRETPETSSDNTPSSLAARSR